MGEYVGLDVSKDETAFCVKDAAGDVLAAGKAASDLGALFEVLKEHYLCPEWIVIGTGALTPWLARGLRARGLEVMVIDARQAHAVMRLQHQKTDAGDAALLCEIARTGFYQEVVVKPEEAQENLGIVKARSHLVRRRQDLENVLRGLMTVPGVGPMTALSYVSVIGEAGRFRRSRTVGAYLGLATRRYQSGEMDYSGRVPKQGDRLLRALLYEAANNMLTVVRRSHPLKDWGRGSHKKACVALARKLAVLMHRMLTTGEPFRWPEAASS
ncbi:IS110 family transposase [Pelagibius litoralis]|uniref:IS110 family transposase n=1 Tax=Pelagibius litoralis TaxID=374515 RepID=A0A967KDC5_9PROT|nr:transposase [Pelagibius litoralis]NIA71339.1 IS110 family transposase [Pelagibius litoralis]